MNKLIKGAVAGAAGITLLLGGAGTFALWNANATFGSEAKISNGTLSLTPVDNASGWHWVNTDGTIGGTFTPGTDKLVPGDEVAYVGKYTVGASGNDLKATLGYTLPGISPTDLQTAGLTATLEANLDGSPLTPSSTVSSVSSSDNNKTLNVALVLDFPSTVTDATTMNKTVTIPSSAAFTLTQSQPTATH
jgi:alternate signal-mediated exported protein